MTYEEREAIFAKEAITLQDFCQLYSLSKGAASVKMNDIKRQVGDRLGIQGRLHVEDYLAWVARSSTTPERYRPRTNNERRATASGLFGEGRL